VNNGTIGMKDSLIIAHLLLRILYQSFFDSILLRLEALLNMTYDCHFVAYKCLWLVAAPLRRLGALLGLASTYSQPSNAR
jgi:hypothetical protein